MQPLDPSKLTPWNLEANTKIFLSDLGVNPKTLSNITFKEIAGYHKSPTIGVDAAKIVKEAKAFNKFLKLSNYNTSINPLRPDVSDIELALIHATKDNIPFDVLASLLNISVTRIKYLRSSTAPLYKVANSPLPSIPLVTITDTSRYWSEDELLETYGLGTQGLHYKDLLRRLKSQGEKLQFPISEPTGGPKDSEGTIPNRTSIPSTLLKEDNEDYSELSDRVWSYVSREEGVSGLLSFQDEKSNNPLTVGSPLGEGYFEVDINYTSNVRSKYNNTNSNSKTRKLTLLEHEHRGKDKLLVPLFIVKLAIKIYNSYVSNEMEPPSLERLVINLLSNPETTCSSLNFPLAPLSSNRGHCMPVRNKSKELLYTLDTPPLVYPKFTSSNYGYGIICHKCNTFLSDATTNKCKHAQIEISKLKNNRPSLVIYTSEPTSDFKYGLYYYSKDIFGFISSVFTKDLLSFYTNFSLPVHRIAYEP